MTPNPPFVCRKVAKNLTFFSQKLPKLVIFSNKIANGNLVEKPNTECEKIVISGLPKRIHQAGWAQAEFFVHADEPVAHFPYFAA